MSHHYSGPNFGFPHRNPQLDFTDLYAFPKVGDASKTILIMNVHPSASFSPSGATTATPFATDALYQLKIDTDNDMVANIIYNVRFATAQDGNQTATLSRVEGLEAAGTGEDGSVLFEGAPVSTGHEVRLQDAGGCRFFAGWRSDPFSSTQLAR